MSNQENIPVLMSRLRALFTKHRMAYDVTWKWGNDPAKVTEAKARMTQAEMEVEDVVRTWVYRELIGELENTEAFKDPSHFDNPGVEFVIAYLKKSRPELRG